MIQLRLGLRRVWRRPLFSLIAVIVLGSGTGIAAAAFRALDRMLLAPPVGITDPDHLAILELASQGSDPPRPNFSYSEVQNLAALSPQIQTAAFLGPDTVSILVLQGPTTIDSVAAHAAFVAPTFFATAGISMARGRGLGLDTKSLLDVGQEVVLGHELWQQLSKTGPLTLGTQLHIRGRVFTLVGVTAPGVTGADRHAADLWLPLGAAGLDGKSPTSSGLDQGYPFRILVREPTGIPAEGVRTEIARELFGAPEPGTPQTGNEAARVRFVSVATPQWATDGIHLPLALILAAVCGAILLIAVANVALLMVARASRATGNIRIQRALGASRVRLLAQHLFENGQVAVVGALLGILISSSFSGVVYHLLSRQGTTLGSPQTWRAIIITGIAMACSVAGVLAIPALYTWRVTADRVGGLLTDHWATSARGWQFTLIAVQVCLTFALLVSSSLFARSFRTALSNRIGISLPGLLYAQVPAATATSAPQTAAESPAVFEQSASDALRQIPGVTHIALASSLPLHEGNVILISIQQLMQSGSTGITLPYVTAVTPSYFATVGSTLLRGRFFTEADGKTAPSVTIIDRTMAQAIWPHTDPLGKCLNVGRPPYHCFTVVGVIEDSPGLRLRDAPPMRFFVPAQQRPDLLSHGGNLLIRVSGNVETGLRDVRTRLAATGLLGDHPTVLRLRALADWEIQPLQTAWVVLGIVSLVGLLLAGVGTYAVCVYFVRARARELGIRMALGASAKGVIWIVLRSTFATILGGAALGGIAVLALARYLAPVLFHVSVYDPMSYGAAILLLGIGAVASLIVPARIATSIDLRQVLTDENT